MKKMKLQYFIILALILSCENSNNPSEYNQLIPLLDGKIWNYDVVIYDSNNALIKEYETKVTVSKIDTNHFLSMNYDYFIHNMFSFVENEDLDLINDSSFISVAFNEDDGFYSSPTKSIAPSLLFSYPPIDTLVYNFIFVIRVDNKDTVISINEKEYATVKYKITLNAQDPKYIHEYYIKPGKGIIKFIHYLKHEEQFYIYKVANLIEEN